MRRAGAIAALALAALCGCQSYDIVQANIFADDRENVVLVEYGRSGSEHVNTFMAPNGKEMEYRSRLVVRVTMPDGDRFTAWQCMNMLGAGTLYRTDNRKWMCHVIGFGCSVYRLAERDGREVYEECYRGTLCESPKSAYAPNPKWRELKKDAEGKWK